MQSRYEAYARADIDYIIKTSCKELAQEDISFLSTWAKESHWQHLEIVNSSEDIVEFKAYYIFERKQFIHHEKSFFKKREDGSWCYEDGEFFESKPNFGRNDTCICGSGKKYKKCCGQLIA